jgi:hypothetical protein
MVADHPDLRAAGAARVARIAGRLTGGHALATDRVLGALAAQPALLDDIDKLLRQPAAGDPDVRHASLADQILGELTERTGAAPRPGPSFRETLVTLAAARHFDEARLLAQVLPTARAADVDLALNETLWTPHRPGDPPRLLGPVRFLALCELAARRPEHRYSWRAVFGKLRGLAVNTPDELPHQLALGEVGLVAAGLAARLRITPADEWLAVLDEVTGTPDPRSPVTGSVDELLTGIPAVPLHRCVGRLVIAQRMLHDPRLTDDEGIDNLRMFIAQRYREIGAENISSGTAYRRRADDYDRIGGADHGA